MPLPPRVNIAPLRCHGDQLHKIVQPGFCSISSFHRLLTCPRLLAFSGIHQYSLKLCTLQNEALIVRMEECFIAVPTVLGDAA